MKRKASIRDRKLKFMLAHTNCVSLESSFVNINFSEVKYMRGIFVSFPDVEAGYNTSIIALSCRRQRKGNPVPGGITGPPCHWGDTNTETWSSRLGVGCKADNLAL
jgi:hypothetical protein